MTREGKFAVGVAWPSFTLSGSSRSFSSIAREQRVNFLDSDFHLTAPLGEFGLHTRLHRLDLYSGHLWIGACGRREGHVDFRWQGKEFRKG